MIHIRPYTPADRAACITLFKSNQPEFFAADELGDFEFWLNGQDEARLAYKNTEEEHYYVVEKDGQPVACGGFYLPPNGEPANMVWGMVGRAHHRQGIGKEFLNYRIGEIKRLREGTKISLDTTQHSFPFFEKLGFKTTKVTKDYYADGLDRHDMVLGLNH